MQMDERLRSFFVGVLGEEQTKLIEGNLGEYLVQAQAAGAEQRTTPPATEDPRIGELAAQVATLTGRLDELATALGALTGQVTEARTANATLTQPLAALAAPAGVTSPLAEPLPVPGTAPAGNQKSVLDNPRYTFRAG